MILRAGKFIAKFLSRPFKEDIGVALIYNAACSVSTLVTALLAFCFGAEARGILGLQETIADIAIFSGVVQVVAYVSFCAAYYPAMAWVKVRAIRKLNGHVTFGNLLAVVFQCGVDFSLHFWVVDVPCHIIGGMIQTAVIWILSSIGIVPLRLIDAVSTIVSQVLADLVFTPLEAPIWRFSGACVRVTANLVCSWLPSAPAQWIKSSAIYSLGANADQLSKLELAVSEDRAA